MIGDGFTFSRAKTQRRKEEGPRIKQILRIEQGRERRRETVDSGQAFLEGQFWVLGFELKGKFLRAVLGFMNIEHSTSNIEWEKTEIGGHSGEMRFTVTSSISLGRENGI